MLTYYENIPDIKDPKKYSFISETSNINNNTSLLIERVSVYSMDRRIEKLEIIAEFNGLKESLGFEYKVFNISFSEYLKKHSITENQLNQAFPKIKIQKVYFVYT